MGLFGFKKKKKGDLTLQVSEKRKLTSDAVAIRFVVPADLKFVFTFDAGQYLTLIHNIKGEEIRRSYSISSSQDAGYIEVGVKQVDGGKMSTYLVDELKVGDELRVLKPEGNFTISDQTKSICCFAAGSGITPILSILKSANSEGIKSQLFFGNRYESSVMYKEELESLKSDSIGVDFYYSRSENHPNIRFDESSIKELIKQDLEVLKSDEFFICGPEEMILSVKKSLEEFGVSKEKIRFELFTTPVLLIEKEKSESVTTFEGVSKVKVLLDGEEIEFELPTKGDVILDKVTDLGYDAPYSCKGAVCCTCRAKVTSGKALMDANYSLSDKEVEEGYILTCQAHPATEELVLDYDS